MLQMIKPLIKKDSFAPGISKIRKESNIKIIVTKEHESLNNIQKKELIWEIIKICLVRNQD